MISNTRGQLILPMLALLVLFAVFLGAYLRWCRHVYWQMRMDITAEAVALSAARAQAAMLNNVASTQMAGNLIYQKADVFGSDIAHLQMLALPAFLGYWGAVNAFKLGYVGQTMMVASMVAKANRADIIPIPWPRPQSRLMARSVTMEYFYGPYYLDISKTFSNVYYQRSWSGGKRNAQPNHVNTWAVAHRGIIGTATARLWLDVSPSDVFANGGFPRPDGGLLEGLGVQCWYPQFNARLDKTPKAAALVLTGLAKALSHP